MLRIKNIIITVLTMIAALFTVVMIPDTAVAETSYYYFDVYPQGVQFGDGPRSTSGTFEVAVCEEPETSAIFWIRVLGFDDFTVRFVGFDMQHDEVHKNQYEPYQVEFDDSYSDVFIPGTIIQYSFFQNEAPITGVCRPILYLSPYVPPTPSEAGETHIHNFVPCIIIYPTKEIDGLEGEQCSCGAIRNTQPLSAYAYVLNEYAASMINAAKPGQTVTFEFGEWNSFPNSFMEKLAAKSAEGVTFVFHYNWNHQKQEITIPAGTTIDLDHDYYGPAKMAELYRMN